MAQQMRLEPIPLEQYSQYRYQVIFKAYKWDPQVEDQNTVCKHALLLSKDTANQLEKWAEQLTQETIQLEENLIHRQDLAALASQLGLPKKIIKTLPHLSGYTPAQNIRLMRFDFHPTTSGWAVSEVNSDVPAGFAEACVLPEIAGQFFPSYAPGPDTGKLLLNAFKERLPHNGVVAFVLATAYSDDRQVLQYLSDYFNAQGIPSFFAGPDQLQWDNGKAVSILEGYTGKVDGIMRYFPVEWLANLPRGSNWQGYYNTQTPSCNYPVSIFAQSKRLPLIWDNIGVEIPTWKQLLPQTKAPEKGIHPGDNWIYKPALGRVGEGISIKEAITPKEYKKIEKYVRRYPKNWILQERFKSRPLLTSDKESCHVCIGVFTVNGKAAGFYARVSPYPRIDAKAQDIPLLVSKEGTPNV